VLGELEPCVGNDEKWAGMSFNYGERSTGREWENLFVGGVFGIVRKSALEDAMAVFCQLERHQPIFKLRPCEGLDPGGQNRSQEN
jgi:hypothetical protein